jgi:hypothetical protein
VSWKRVARDRETKDPMKHPREMANEVTGPYLREREGAAKQQHLK